MIKEGFLIGASTAAYQVEGNNNHTDFWAMEHLEHSMFLEKSGDAVDHYNRYEEDIRTMAENGLNAYRFGIEWARIEPKRGEWDEYEIEHYRKVIRCCRKYSIEPIVTLHHFSSPKWLIENGGWENPETADAFAVYSEKIASELGNELTYVCTINEANMGIQMARMMPGSNPGEEAGSNEVVQVGTASTDSGGDMDIAAFMMQAMSDMATAFGGMPNIFLFPRTADGDQIIMDAHVKARRIIKKVRPNIKVGLTLSLFDIQHEPGGEGLAEQLWDEAFTHYLPAIAEDDFIGIQNYTRKIVGKDGVLPVPEGSKCTQMGYENYPDAISNVVRRVASDFNGELLITENGIATECDQERCAFIEKALEGIQRCVDDGILLRGYLHWSLLDNFEWMAGYGPKFGLIRVDRNTQTRYPKESLKLLGSYASR